MIYRNQHCIAINFKSHTYLLNTKHKSQCKKICLVIYSWTDTFFAVKGVFFLYCISFSLCQIIKPFLCTYIITMHVWRTYFLSQPLSICHSHIRCSLVMFFHLSLFLLCLSTDISSCSDFPSMRVWPKRSSLVAFQLKGFFCGWPVNPPGHCCFQRHCRVSFLCKWQK